MQQLMTESGRLVDDLGRVLGSDDFRFRGRPYHFAFRPTWTNPCLSVTGLGPIGLPLSDCDAEAMKASEYTSYDGDTIWSIDANHIMFSNREWEDTVHSMALDIYAELGIESSAHPLECRLDGLLLFGPGSRHESTAIPALSASYQDELVANMLIALPSKYEGGGIELSPYLRSEPFTALSSCTAATCFWGWHSDVPCNIKPISSGHRLALLFKIVKTSSPRPIFPDTISGIEALRSIFKKWREGEYREAPTFRYVFYPLIHEYSIEQIRKRKMVLRGEDAYKVACLQTSIFKTGYKMCFACCRRSFENAFAAKTILRLFDMNTWEELSHDESDMIIHADSVIPSSNPRHEVSSKDTVDYESSLPDAEHTDDADTVLLFGIFIYHADDEEISLLGLQGTQSILPRLKESLASPNRTEKEMMMGRHIMQTFDVQAISSDDFKDVLIDYALKYENFDIWEAVTKAPLKLSRDNMDKFFIATQLFGFDRMEKSMQNAIDHNHYRLIAKVHFLCELPSAGLCQESQDALVKWCKDNVDTLMSKPLLRESPGYVNLIPALSHILQVFGLQHLEEMYADDPVLVDRLADASLTFRELGTIEYDDIPLFVFFLGQHKLKNLPPHEAEVTNHLLNLCFKLVIHDLASDELWRRTYLDRIEFKRSGSYRQMRIVTASMWAVDACTKYGKPQRFKELLDVLLNSRGDAYTKVLRFYMPFIQTFHIVLDEPEKYFPSSYFPVDFLRAIIWKYLNAMLGTKSINPRLPARRIGMCSGCQCECCIQLDTFMLRPHIRILRFDNLKPSKRSHIQSVAEKADDLVTVKSLPSYRMEITKLPQVLAFARWEDRVAEANRFLQSVGPKEEIQRIMGDDYDEFRKAMRGEETVKLRKWTPEEIKRRNSDLREFDGGYITE